MHGASGQWPVGEPDAAFRPLCGRRAAGGCDRPPVGQAAVSAGGQAVGPAPAVAEAAAALATGQVAAGAKPAEEVPAAAAAAAAAPLVQQAQRVWGK